MIIPKDCWHEPLLIPVGDEYTINAYCRLGDPEKISTWLSTGFPECFAYIKEKILKKDIGVKV